MVVTEFGKFKCNHLPMGMWGSGYILKDRVDNLIGNSKVFNTYINYILSSSKGIFYNKIGQLWLIFYRLCAAEMKFNVPKWSFGLKEINYLGYVIHNEGIKSDMNKLKGIMDIGIATTITK